MNHDNLGNHLGQYVSSLGTEPSARVSHMCVDCRSVHNWDQNGILKAKRTKVLFYLLAFHGLPRGGGVKKHFTCEATGEIRIWDLLVYSWMLNHLATVLLQAIIAVFGADQGVKVNFDQLISAN